MKKWINRQTIAAFLIGIILSGGISAGAATLYQFSLSPDTLYVDGTKIDESVYKYKDVNYLPIRTVAEAFGAEIDYGYGRIDIDTELDIGLLEAPVVKFAVKLGDTDRLEIGQSIVNIGCPGGVKNLVYDGKITGLSDGILSSNKAYPGSSGSGLFDMEGNLIGIVDRIYAESEDIIRSVPVNEVKKILDSLK